jgi:hypothetical protein
MGTMSDATRHDILMTARRARRAWFVEQATHTMLFAMTLAAMIIAVRLAIAIKASETINLPPFVAFLLLVAPCAWGSAALTRRSLVGAAQRLDARLGLQQQFPTAVELALRDTDDDPATTVCYTQAMTALAGRTWSTPPVVRQNARRRAAILAIALVMCAVLAAWSHARATTNDSDSLIGMTDAQREALVEAFGSAASQTDDAQLRRLLESAAIAVEDVDEDELAERLEALRKKGYLIVSLEVPAVRQALDLPPATSAPPASVTPTPPALSDSDIPLVPAGTTIYFPADHTDDTPLAPPSDQVPFEDAWDIARRRAMNQLNDGDIPPEYRQVVSHYFAAP